MPVLKGLKSFMNSSRDFPKTYSGLPYCADVSGTCAFIPLYMQAMKKTLLQALNPVRSGMHTLKSKIILLDELYAFFLGCRLDFSTL